MQKAAKSFFRRFFILIEIKPKLMFDSKQSNNIPL
jgi:hypothetical protein